jgi:hypothetical protein
LAIELRACPQEPARSRPRISAERGLAAGDAAGQRKVRRRSLRAVFHVNI